MTAVLTIRILRRTAVFLFHPERALFGAGEELADEGIRRREHVVAAARLDDPALPEDTDVFAELARGVDVVRDHDVGAAVLLVHLHDELAQQGRAYGIQP